MKQKHIKTFTNTWDSIFKKHPQGEAFLLSLACHFVLLSFLWACCEIHTMIFPQKTHERIINIEFDSGES